MVRQRERFSCQPRPCAAQPDGGQCTSMNALAEKVLADKMGSLVCHPKHSDSGTFFVYAFPRVKCA